MDVWQSTRKYLGWQTLFNLLHDNRFWCSTFTFRSLSISNIYARSSRCQLNKLALYLPMVIMRYKNRQNFIDPLMRKLNVLYNTPTVGASGAVFGLLLAFGMLFPNTLIYLYFAIPIKAKYFCSRIRTTRTVAWFTK